MNLTRISKRMSYLLRHNENFIDKNGGWAKVSILIDKIREKYPDFNKEVLDEIVRTDAKMRYSYDESGDWIRANQGHSVPGVLVELDKLSPPEILYHGTAKRFLPSIMQQGLKPQSRLYVHLSWDYDTAVSVGKRHGEPVVLKIKAEEMQKAGYEFFLSKNKIWLTKEVPVEFLEE